MFVRVVVFHNVIPTRRRSHGPSEHQDPCLVVTDTVPVGYKYISHNLDATSFILVQFACLRILIHSRDMCEYSICAVSHKAPMVVNTYAHSHITYHARAYMQAYTRAGRHAHT